MLEQDCISAPTQTSHDLMNSFTGWLSIIDIGYGWMLDIGAMVNHAKFWLLLVLPLLLATAASAGYSMNGSILWWNPNLVTSAIKHDRA